MAEGYGFGGEGEWKISVTLHTINASGASHQPSRWHCLNAPHLVPLVRAGATFVNGKLVERPHNQINEVSYSVPETSRQPSPLRVFMLVVSGRPALTATILISKQAA
jgi:hypothetical protein